MTYKILVDKDTCIGCAACSGVSPNFFKMNNDGKAEPVNEKVDDLGNAKEGQDSCPVGAIKIDNA